MADEDVKQLADAWKAAYAKLWDASQPPIASPQEWEAKHNAYEEAEKAYYRLLRDRYGWDPPVGVLLEDEE
jgi:hypothetical protein